MLLTILKLHLKYLHYSLDRVRMEFSPQVLAHGVCGLFAGVAQRQQRLA